MSHFGPNAQFLPPYLYLRNQAPFKEQGLKSTGKGDRAHLYEGSGAEINDVITSSYMSLLPLRFDFSEAARSLIVVTARPKARDCRYLGRYGFK